MKDLREEVRRRLAGAPLEPTRAIEIVDEIAMDLEQRHADLLARGVAPEQAAARILAELDGLAAEVRRVERPPATVLVPGAPRRGLLPDLWHDLRHAARGLLKSRGFTIVTVLSLALGIGANTAIFQLLDAIHLRPLPVARPAELAVIKIGNRKGGNGSFTGSHPDLTDPLWQRIRDGQQGFQGVFAWNEGEFNLAATGEKRAARGVYASGEIFTVLGLAPALGRLFGPADDQRGCAGGAVVSYAFWQRELGGDPGAVGRKLSLDGHDTEILGVAPAGFTGLEVGRSFDVAVPLCMDALLRGAQTRLGVRHEWFLAVMGRLKPGWSIERATAQLQAISPAMFADTVPASYTPDWVDRYRAYRLAALPAASGVSTLRGTYSEPLTYLLGIAGMVLLIACANLANLLLARASAREREMAVRLALGASRGRLVRQLMTESLLLAAVGGALGLWLAGNLGGLMVTFLTTRDQQLFVDLAPDWRVLAFTAGLATLTCLLFGLAPALRAARTDVGLVLKATGGHGATPRLGLRRLLVVAQIALSFVLLCGALLFTRSLMKLSSVETGFDERGVIIIGADLRKLDLPRERLVAFQEELVARVRAAPGVAAAASTAIIPVSESIWNETLAGDESDELVVANFSRVSPGYLETLRIPLLAGRDLSARDGAGAPRVAVVNEALARAFFGGKSPLGHRLKLRTDPTKEQSFEIVGLVRDTKYGTLREKPSPLVFVPLAQDDDPYPGVDIVLRGDAPLADVLASVKRAVAEVSPSIILEVDMLERVIRDSTLRDRLMALVSGFFGFLAALLAVIGLYGVVAYGVARRTHEIGIRMALGAGAGRIAGMVVRETTMLLAAGLGLGVILALAVTRLAGSMLYGLTPRDPLTYLAALTLMALVALVASLLPARRAARVDPMVALKEE